MQRYRITLRDTPRSGIHPERKRHEMSTRLGTPYRHGLKLARCNALDWEVPTTITSGDTTVHPGSLALGWVDRHDSAGFCFKTGAYT